MPLSDPEALEGDGAGTNTRGPAPLLPAGLRGGELPLLRWPPHGTAPSRPSPLRRVALQVGI